MESMANRTDPECAVRSLAEKADGADDFRHSRKSSCRLPAGQFLQAGNGANPNCSVECLDNRFDPVLADFTAQMKFGRRTIFETDKSGPARPQAATTVFMDGVNCYRWKAIRVVYPLNSVADDL